RAKFVRDLASVHTDEAARVAAADTCGARKRLLALRCAWAALSRCNQLVVGESLRALQSPHQRRAHRPARKAGACVTRRLHARTRCGALRTTVTRDPRSARPLFLRERRSVSGRDRAQDELPLLAQLRPRRKTAVRELGGKLSRRNAGCPGGDRRRTVQ